MSVVYTMCVPHPPLIIPEIGRGREKGISQTIQSYHEVMKKAASYHPDTVVVISPHSLMYADYIHISPGIHAHGDFGQFMAKEVKIDVDYDDEFVSYLSDLCEHDNIPAGTLGERNPALDHGTMIPLYFLQKYAHDFKVVRIGISGLSYAMHYAFGKEIAKAANDLHRKVVIIASGDLSHKLKPDGPYGYAKEGPVFDEKIMRDLGKGDFLSILSYDYDFCENAAECGLRSFQMMAGALDCHDVISHVYSHEGPFGVGYGVADFEVDKEDQNRNFGDQFKAIEEKRMQETRENEDAYVKLARLCVEYYIRDGRLPEMPDDLPQDMLAKRAGVFVSLHEHGQLRGCIGTFKPTMHNIAEEIMQNAVSACSRDPRFSKVEPNELNDLVYSVDVLGDIEDIEDISELDPKRYGVIVTHGRKRGLLLPNLPGVSTVLEQLDIARRKAGIREDEPTKLSRFEVVRHT